MKYCLKDSPRVLVAKDGIDQLRLILVQSNHLVLVHAKVALLHVLVVERVDARALGILLLRELVQLSHQLGCFWMLAVQDGVSVVDL